MLQLDLKSGVPICDQIINGFIRLKALGVMSGDEKLPSVRELASKLSVNPNTVQKAYAILESSGVIYSVKGKGSFMSDDGNAHSAIHNKALTDFSVAVSVAKQLGLSKNEMLKTVERIFSDKESETL